MSHVPHTSDPKAEDERRRQVIGARRRNNIYGEVDDYIVMSFLAIGGEGAIFTPGIVYSDASTHEGAVVSMYGRSMDNLYVMRLTDGLLTIDGHNHSWITDLSLAATAIGATAVIAVPNKHLKRAKFYNVDGARIHYFT